MPVLSQQVVNISMYYNNKEYVFRFIFGDYIHQYLKELYHTTLLEQWKLHPDKSAYEKNFYFGAELPS